MLHLKFMLECDEQLGGGMTFEDQVGTTDPLSDGGDQSFTASGPSQYLLEIHACTSHMQVGGIQGALVTGFSWLH
jgi:hypothetical protein